MKVVFLHRGPTFDGDSLSRGPLGGTETALIGVARALAEDANLEVHVFTNTPLETVYAGVRYHPVSAFAAWARVAEIEVLISLREWTPFLLPVSCRLRVYFSPDAWNQPFLRRAFDANITVRGEPVTVPLFEPSLFMDDVDAIFCVGGWQAETFVSKLRFPAEKIFVTGNAVFLENFRPLPREKRPPIALYSATPFRGLEHLVRLWPDIARSHPAARLEVFSGMGVYGIEGGEDERQYGALYRAVRDVGGISHGPVAQMELARRMCSARVYAYPNTFAETFCISVAEAQAAGLPVVTSRVGALTERVEDGVDGFLIEGSPGTPDYDSRFVHAVTKLFEDDALWERMSRASIAKASTRTYGHLAASWRRYFDEALRERGEARLPGAGKLRSLSELRVQHPSRPGLTLQLNRRTLEYFLDQAFAVYGFGPAEAVITSSAT